MKREIKFRGKKVDLGGTKDTSFVYGFLSNIEFINDKFGNGHCVDYKTIGQFTGLKDREAKEIYEGDIVKFKSGSATPINIIHEGKELIAYEPIFNIGCVVFYKGSFGLHNEFDTDSHLENSKYNGTSYYGNIQNNEYRMEIIGNIHENPELLTVNN